MAHKKRLSEGWFSDEEVIRSPSRRWSPSDEQDMDLAMNLLAGFPRALDLMARRKYLSPGTQENAGRAALVRILRNCALSDRNLMGSLCLLLAELFAPNGAEAYGNSRRLDFVFRSQNHPNADRDRVIAMHVWDRRKRGMSEEEAVAEVANLTDLGDRQIRKICARFRPEMESWRGSLPKRARHRSG
jgi:hypothetical protein